MRSLKEADVKRHHANVQALLNNCSLSLKQVVHGPESPETTHEKNTINEDITERHYVTSDKEQRKLRPSKDVIKKYLDLEFLSRKKVLQETPKEARPEKIFQSYPCFKNASEVLIN